MGCDRGAIMLAVLLVTHGLGGYQSYRAVADQLEHDQRQMKRFAASP
jgi:hypothetical protein